MLLFIAFVYFLYQFFKLSHCFQPLLTAVLKRLVAEIITKNFLSEAQTQIVLKFEFSHSF